MEERDSRGRFTRGNCAGRGNHGGRPKHYATEYADVMKQGLTLKSWRKIVDRAIEQAIEGDHRARQWLAEYVMGKPIQLIAADVQNGPRERLISTIEGLRALLPSVDESN